MLLGSCNIEKVIGLILPGSLGFSKNYSAWGWSEKIVEYLSAEYAKTNYAKKRQAGERKKKPMHKIAMIFRGRDPF